MTSQDDKRSLEGGCFCGAVRYRVTGRPGVVAHCHCKHCRRTSGAPFVTWAEFDAAGFAVVQGTPGRYETRPQVTRLFCTACGTQLAYQHAKATATIDITVCSLDEPEGLVPKNHIWCDRMLPWIELADDLPRHAGKRQKKDA